MHWKAIYQQWFSEKNWTPAEFQISAANAYFQGNSGLINAPTGMGKTYSIGLPAIIDAFQKKRSNKGVFMLWITPLKALSNDIADALQFAANSVDPGFKVLVRTGDTSAKIRNEIKTKPPACLVTTPETLHLLLASKNYEKYFANLELVVVDEWHELLSSKRGVQVELAVSWLKNIKPSLRIWGISATIGNLQNAMDVLLASVPKVEQNLIQVQQKKTLEIHTILPESIEKFPWSGHMGLMLLPKVIPIIESARTTLIFTNTRGQSETWYQNLLDENQNLAGRIAIHHGSLNQEVRNWVEQSLHQELLKAVVCTSSLDLGVDFRPVDTVIQIGSPKSVARFIQRAGRSGHRPNAPSKIYFLPTNSLELLDALAIKDAVDSGFVESREPITLAYDVLLQFICTLAVSDGFDDQKLFQSLKNTYCYKNLKRAYFHELLLFLEGNSKALSQYDEYKKLEFIDGLYKIQSRKLAMMHRLSIGTIVSDQSVLVKQIGKGILGSIEEYFISKLKQGDNFVFAGRVLSFVKLEGNMAIVRKTEAKKAIIPSWMGGRLSLSSELSHLIRKQIQEFNHHRPEEENLKPEVKMLIPLMEVQKQRSLLPKSNQMLIESYHSNEGHHLFVYPFEGRLVNEGLAMLLAYRISKILPLTFSISMNDYGFELLCDSDIPIETALELDVFTVENLSEDIEQCANYSEMCKRKFSDIAVISGLLFKGKPDKQVKARHLQASAKLFYQVFSDYEPNNLLLEQARNEVYLQQLQMKRISEALNRINGKELLLKEIQKPTPFCFGLIVDRLREQLTSEKIEDRIVKMLMVAQ